MSQILHLGPIMWEKVKSEEAKGVFLVRRVVYAITIYE